MATKQLTRTTKQAPAKAAKSAVKAAPAKRTTRQPAQAKQTAAKALLTVASIKFLTTNRPGAGNHLASYSAAWMAITGFDNGVVLPRSTVLKLAGDTAVKYHLSKNNFEETATGMRITAQGKLHFAGKSEVSGNRNIRPIPEYVEAYKEFFLNGTLNSNIGLKNDTFKKAASF